MNAAEFINICQVAGYASKATATRYCKESGREDFTDDDFSEVFRLNEHRNTMKNLGYRPGGGCKVPGDALIEALRYKPLGWNQTFDASRGEIGDRKAGGGKKRGM